MNPSDFSEQHSEDKWVLSLTKKRHLRKLTGIVVLLFMLTGCANYGSPRNLPVPDPSVDKKYSFNQWASAHNDKDVRLILTFSGGGTRAAALSYGVLQELRDTTVNHDGDESRLLDEIDFISSVSGGSFTSAYYGLHGDGIFENFENDFLRYNLEKHLLLRAINPLLLFSRKGRTESAIKYYQKFLFHDATFADMIRPDRPMIIINASDLAYGVRFSFIQEYFDLLCSDLSTFPVAEAVAASSAVPVLFDPVVVKNHDTCSDMQLIGPAVLDKADEYYQGENLPALISQLETYGNKDKRKFVHFVDGGITDNLGLRALSDTLVASGGSKGARERFISKSQKTPRRIVVIMVNAATALDAEIDSSIKNPSASRVMDAVSGLQLTRYNETSILMIKDTLRSMAEELSTPEQPVDTHFINVSIQDVEKPDILEFLNKVPTSFSLTDDQVDQLIESGRVILRNNPEFINLVNDLNVR
jgi:NTE family protein